MIVAIRTDNPEAFIGVYDSAGHELARHTWHADRRLAKELLAQMHALLQNAGGDWPAVSGVVVFAGPGSFTGLRIGVTVANALAYGNNVPVVAAQGEDWLKVGIRRLKNNGSDRIALPHYGAEANITMPAKNNMWLLYIVVALPASLLIAWKFQQVGADFWVSWLIMMVVFAICILCIKAGVGEGVDSEW